MVQRDSRLLVGLFVAVLAVVGGYLYVGPDVGAAFGSLGMAGVVVFNVGMFLAIIATILLVGVVFAFLVAKLFTTIG